MLELLRGLLVPFEVALLVTALIVTTSEPVEQIITTYQVQSWLLAGVTGLTAAIKVIEGERSSNSVVILILFIVVLPIALAVIIKQLLIRATVPVKNSSSSHTTLWAIIKRLLIRASVRSVTGIRNVDLKRQAQRVKQLLIRATVPVKNSSSSHTTLWAIIKRLLIRAPIRSVTGIRNVDLKRQAQREWLKYRTAVNVQPGPTVNTQPRDLLIFVVLVTVAFLIAFQIIAAGFPPSDRIGLTVSLALHLVGLYNMVIKREIISQVLGLLIMDHGLYLAVVKIVAIPVPATFFVISLYFYTLITIFILVILLPQVREVTGSIDLSEISEKSDLKG